VGSCGIGILPMIPSSSSGNLAIKTCPSSSPASHTTMVLSHSNATPANLRARAVQGRRRYARTRRRFSMPTTSRALAAFSGGGSWAEPLWQTAHKRIPAEGVRWRASPSGLRPRPLVRGLFSFRARVILLPDGPPRSTPRLPVRAKVPPFPLPEPPLPSSESRPASLPGDLRSMARMHRLRVVTPGRDVQQF